MRFPFLFFCNDLLAKLTMYNRRGLKSAFNTTREKAIPPMKTFLDYVHEFGTVRSVFYQGLSDYSQR